MLAASVTLIVIGMVCIAQAPGPTGATTGVYNVQPMPQESRFPDLIFLGTWFLVVGMGATGIAALSIWLVRKDRPDYY